MSDPDLLALIAALERRIASLEQYSQRTHLGAPEQYTVNRGDPPPAYEWLPVPTVRH